MTLSARVRKRLQARATVSVSKPLNAATIAAFRSALVGRGCSLETRSTAPQTKKSSGLRSGELGGHCLGHVIPPYFFEPGLRMTGADYRAVLRTHVFPWIKSVVGDKHWVWQQDGARPHTARDTVEYLEGACPEFIRPEQWPPNSPELNPLDFFVLGAVSNEQPRPTKADLKATIVAAFNGLETETVARAYSRFRTRTDKVMKAGGQYPRY